MKNAREENREKVFVEMGHVGIWALKVGASEQSINFAPSPISGLVVCICKTYRYFFYAFKYSIIHQ